MKKYVFEAAKRQWERPTEPKNFFQDTAKVTVFANTEEEAKVLAVEQLRKDYYGTGILLGEARVYRVSELPIDWCYGYDSSALTETSK